MGACVISIMGSGVFIAKTGKYRSVTSSTNFASQTFVAKIAFCCFDRSKLPLLGACGLTLATGLFGLITSSFRSAVLPAGSSAKFRQFLTRLALPLLLLLVCSYHVFAIFLAIAGAACGVIMPQLVRSSFNKFLRLGLSLSASCDFCTMFASLRFTRAAKLSAMRFVHCFSSLDSLLLCVLLVVNRRCWRRIACPRRTLPSPLHSSPSFAHSLPPLALSFTSESSQNSNPNCACVAFS